MVIFYLDRKALYPLHPGKHGLSKETCLATCQIGSS
jgi:hypothetical protein